MTSPVSEEQQLAPFAEDEDQKMEEVDPVPKPTKRKYTMSASRWETLELARQKKAEKKLLAEQSKHDRLVADVTARILKTHAKVRQTTHEDEEPGDFFIPPQDEGFSQHFPVQPPHFATGHTNSRRVHQPSQNGWW